MTLRQLHGSNYYLSTERITDQAGNVICVKCHCSESCQESVTECMRAAREARLEINQLKH